MHNRIAPWLTLLVTVLIAVALGWALRYEIGATREPGGIFKVNRWTGTTYSCRISACVEVPHRPFQSSD